MPNETQFLLASLIPPPDLSGLSLICDIPHCPQPAVGLLGIGAITLWICSEHAKRASISPIPLVALEAFADSRRQARKGGAQ